MWMWGFPEAQGSLLNVCFWRQADLCPPVTALASNRNLIALRNRGELAPGLVIDLDAFCEARGADDSFGVAGDVDRQLGIGGRGRFDPVDHGVDLGHHAVACGKPCG